MNITQNNFVKNPSPNFNERPAGTVIDTIILHYTGMQSAEAAINKMCEAESNVSAHYCIDESGQIYNLVDDEKRAWHAGKSFWSGVENLNNNSIGIEVVNKGHEFGYTKFPEIQMQAVLKLLEVLFKKHPIKKELVLAHSDIAPDRKEDPGEFFNWQLLAENGFSIWHNLPNEFFVEPKNKIEFGAIGATVQNIQTQLTKFGYKINLTSEFDAQTKQVIAAFYRRFIPAYILANKNTRHPENIFWCDAAMEALNKVL